MSITYIPADLRRTVRDRAGERCEYCLIPESASFSFHQIDHIIAEKHGGLTQLENLGLSCALCNQFKGADLSSIDPDTNQIAALFHPRRDRWTDHFRLAEARIEGLTPTGRTTARLLQFNHSDRIEERVLLVAAGMITTPTT